MGKKFVIQLVGTFCCFQLRYLKFKSPYPICNYWEKKKKKPTPWMHYHGSRFFTTNYYGCLLWKPITSRIVTQNFIHNMGYTNHKLNFMVWAFLLLHILLLGLQPKFLLFQDSGSQPIFPLYLYPWNGFPQLQSIFTQSGLWGNVQGQFI